MQQKGKGHTFNYSIHVCICLAEFRPAPGFCTCQTSKLMILKVFFKKVFQQSSTPQFSFKSGGQQAVFRPPETETLAPRQIKKCISTYNMKIQKIHQKQKLSKSTSSKTEVALLSLHSVLKWLLKYVF